MKDFLDYTFDPAVCQKELREFKKLLARKRELSESQDILPFFRKRPQLSVFVASWFPGMDNFDRLAYEYSIFGDFTCDLAVGDSQSQTFCFVEFEDACSTSLFKVNPARATLEWSPRFEHGFSQIVDWFWKLDDMRNTTVFQNQFGVGHVRYYGLLVLGRTIDLSLREQTRLRWRLEKVLVDSRPVFCVTLDELCNHLDRRLRHYGIQNGKV